MTKQYQYFLVFLPLLIISVILLSNFLSCYVFAASPSFGYREIRDPFRDLIDMKCLKDLKVVATNKCVHTNERNQSTDIIAVDFFSNGRFLNATIWLVSPVKESTSNNREETNYGMFIDADSNQKTGLQGIDYQVENSRKDGKWDRTFYDFSSSGHRILNETKNYTPQFYQKNNNYVTLYADLSAMGSPDKYRVMFYAEELEGTTNNPIFWVDDFTNWIDIPRPELTVLTTPSQVVLRPGQADSYGIQLVSNTTPVPQVSNFTVEENTRDVELKFIHNPLYNSDSINEPDSFDIKIPEDAKIGTYNIPIITNVTQTSTIPNMFGFKSLPLNTAYEFDKLNLPVTVLKRMTIGEQLADFNKTWIEPLSGIYTFMGGLLTGGAAQWLYKRIRRKQSNSNKWSKEKQT
jgi:hypothetical protein